MRYCVPIILFAGSAYCQTISTSSILLSSSAATATTGTTNLPLTHTISVAYAGFTFQPDVTLAAIGDVIEFDFFPTNHSVVRAEYGYPCIPYEDTGVDKVGFFSGFQPVDAILPEPPKFAIRVNDTNPIFYYCSAPGSCINYAMVGVVNPNASTSLATQQTLAKNSSFMLQPGEPWPAESDNPFTTSSSNPQTTSTTTSSTDGSSSSSSSSSSVHPGAIAGIVIGATAVALIAAVLLYLCGRNSRKLHPSSTMQYESREAYMSDPNSHVGNMASLEVSKKHMSTMTRATTMNTRGTSSVYHPPHNSEQSGLPFQQPFQSQVSSAYVTSSTPQPIQSMAIASPTSPPERGNSTHTAASQRSQDSYPNTHQGWTSAQPTVRAYQPPALPPSNQTSQLLHPTHPPQPPSHSTTHYGVPDTIHELDAQDTSTEYASLMRDQSISVTRTGGPREELVSRK